MTRFRPTLFKTALTPALLVLFLGGLALLFLGGSALTLLRVRESQSWPTTEGQMVASRVDSRLQRNSAITRLYHPDVIYSYNVDGEQYIGTQVWALSRLALLGQVVGQNPSTTDRRAVEDVIARYPAGQVVRVYYDPKHPGVSALETGVPLGIGQQVTWGTAFGSAALAVIIAFQTHLPARLGRAIMRAARSISRETPPAPES